MRRRPRPAMPAPLRCPDCPFNEDGTGHYLNPIEVSRMQHRPLRQAPEPCRGREAREPCAGAADYQREMRRRLSDRG